jgi:plastocyanin
MKKIGTFLAAMAFVAALVTACGGSSSSVESTAAVAETSSAPNPTAVAGPTITIANMTFGRPLTVGPGTQVNIVNNDSVEHSVTSDTAGAFDQDVEGNEKATMTAPSKPGEYPFHCSYHPNMKGTLIVK